MDEANIFETTNVDLASYLVFEGMKLLECAKKSHQNIVIMRFLDDTGQCLDLERVYLNSEYKKFRDINKWLLKKIHATLKERH